MLQYIPDGQMFLKWLWGFILPISPFTLFTSLAFGSDDMSAVVIFYVLKSLFKWEYYFGALLFVSRIFCFLTFGNKLCHLLHREGWKGGGYLFSEEKSHEEWLSSSREGWARGKWSEERGRQHPILHRGGKGNFWL